MKEVRVINNFKNSDIILKIFDLEAEDTAIEQGWVELLQGNETVLSYMFYVGSLQSIDSDETLASLLEDLSRNPDSNDELAEEQYRFLQEHAEMFGLYALELLRGVA